MILEFSKYQGTGNDFILINNFENKLIHNPELAVKLCNRHYGIGSDGLIIIEKHKNLDFNMTFYNPDGNQSFCGNGSRCAVKFAIDNKIINKSSTKFNSTDGLHLGYISNNIIEIEMNKPEFLKLPIINISNFEIDNIDILNTGSPHLVFFFKNEKEVKQINVNELGAPIRYNKEFENIGGVNVNFVYPTGKSKIFIRTYERGVENETLSCGTGVTASAISYHKLYLNKAQTNNIKVLTLGGELNVKFDFENNKYKNIKLCGPAQFIYSGEILI